jgi:predicted molibdopterin-dependent oxidoreductase YjgC
MFGFVPGAVGAAVGGANTAALRQAVEAGRVPALYVFDPGPEGSMGDTDWIVAARSSGALTLLIVQGVLMTKLAAAADFVLPGASSLEKQASYTNEQGRLQGTAYVLPPPGDALDDWRILVNLAAALGVAFHYTTAAQVRTDIVARFPGVAELAGLVTLTFGEQMEARNWLQGSNPSERWKWEFMFQDLPPVKGNVDPSSLPLPPGAIELKKV